MSHSAYHTAPHLFATHNLWTSINKTPSTPHTSQRLWHASLQHVPAQTPARRCPGANRQLPPKHQFRACPVHKAPPETLAACATAPPHTSTTVPQHCTGLCIPAPLGPALNPGGKACHVTAARSHARASHRPLHPSRCQAKPKIVPAKSGTLHHIRPRPRIRVPAPSQPRRRGTRDTAQQPSPDPKSLGRCAGAHWRSVHGNIGAHGLKDRLVRPRRWPAQTQAPQISASVCICMSLPCPCATY